MYNYAIPSLLLCAWSTAQVITDPGVYGPPIELVHLYYDEFPTGIAVSSTGRLFSNYPGGLDANDTNNGSNGILLTQLPLPLSLRMTTNSPFSQGKYTIAELVTNTTESPFPSAEINNPPGGAINYTTYPPTGAGYAAYFIGSQSIVVDPAERAWVLDTGRVLTPNGTWVDSTYGGPKLVGIDLTNNTVFQTILFPPTVAYGDSYLNDVRFDLRPNITASGKGVAYITDSSSEGRNGLIIADLGTGESWRHLDGNPQVRPIQQFLTYLWGVPIYGTNPGKPFGYLTFGADGIAISADGENLYWKSVSTRYLYSIPTARLRDNSPLSEFLAQQSVVNHGETGVTDGMETDTNGFIYHGNMEQSMFFSSRLQELGWVLMWGYMQMGYRSSTQRMGQIRCLCGIRG
jgi:sugar lactone lactonase YvrE